MNGESTGLRCRICGGALPVQAMFCGECGSAARHPGWMDASLDRAAATRREGRPADPGPAHGRHVSARIGSPLHVLSGPERARPVPAPESETTVRTGGDRPEPRPAGRPVLELRPEPAEPAEPGEPAEPAEPESAEVDVPGEGAEREGRPVPDIEAEPWSDPWQPSGRESIGEREPAWLRERDPEPVAKARADRGAESAIDPGPEARSRTDVEPDASSEGEPRVEIPARDPATGSASVPFGTVPDEPTCGSVVARFSTGEVVTLHGTGLIGRNPTPAEGERYDVLVRIHDPARSVSKTHLEFVVDAGRLWIRDRHSGNGTILRHPNGTGSRCEGGRRYRVDAADRVEIGEQFFDLR